MYLLTITNLSIKDNAIYVTSHDNKRAKKSLRNCTVGLSFQTIHAWLKLMVLTSNKDRIVSYLTSLSF